MCGIDILGRDSVDAWREPLGHDERAHVATDLEDLLQPARHVSRDQDRQQRQTAEAFVVAHQRAGTVLGLDGPRLAHPRERLGERRTGD